MDRIIEICCGSYEDCLNASRGGATRVELNSALHLGGLTPSVASLRLTKANTNLKVICMVRPRGAGFSYREEEFEVMKEDAKILMANGADGLAFGFLKDDASIDVEKTKALIEIVKAYEGEVVFHRAFDCVKDPYQAMETLIELGVDRVLTSGLEAKAMDGMALIQSLHEKYGDRIEILAGSGMNASNAKIMMDTTGIHQVHSSCKAWLHDPTTTTGHVSYSYATNPNENNFDVVSEALVKQLVESI